jgi:hypothetical protein
MARDRMETETLPLTHELLGHLLGVVGETLEGMLQPAHARRERL